MDGPDDGTAHVWLLRTDVPAATLVRHAATLDTAERRRAAELLHPAHRRRFVAAHGAVRDILGGYLGTDAAAIRWRYGEHGKPNLDLAHLDLPRPGVRSLQVNLSHSSDLAALAVSTGREVGVDLQWCSPTLAVDRLAQRFYPPAEASFVGAATTPADAIDRFVRLWARKEAVVKAAGRRIIRHLGLPVTDLDRVDATADDLVVRAGGLPDAYRVRDLVAPPGFRAALAMRGTDRFRVTSRWWNDGHDGDVTASDSVTSTSSTPRSHDSRSAGDT